MMVWLMMLVGCGEPDAYEECERVFELSCECDDQCFTEEEVAESCEVDAPRMDAAYAECFNDVRAKDCDMDAAEQECEDLAPE